MKVCTTNQLAAFYGCGEENIQKNYKRNADRFLEGVHFVNIEGAELKEFKSRLPTISREALKFAPSVFLWTEKGAARQCFQLDC